MKQLFEKETIYDFGPFKKEAIIGIKTTDEQLLIICQKSDFDKHQDLLSKISQAIGFQNASIINLNFEICQYYPIDELNPKSCFKQILSFGISPKSMGLPSHLNTNKQYRFEAMNYCYTSSLEKMSIDQNAKKAFWTFAKQNLVNS